jgi:hypothetical protein
LADAEAAYDEVIQALGLVVRGYGWGARLPQRWGDRWTRAQHAADADELAPFGSEGITGGARTRLVASRRSIG